MQPFKSNSEISRITLWDRRRDIGKIDAIDQALIERIDAELSSSDRNSRVPAPDDDGSRILESRRYPCPVDQSVKFTLILACFKGRYLQVYDNTRAHWEFPTGGIEKGESWKECAIRETREESGQNLRDPQLVWIVRAYFPRRGVIAYGAIVTGRLTEIMPFQATNEISGIRLWDPRSEESGLDSYNRAVWELVAGSP